MDSVSELFAFKMAEGDNNPQVAMIEVYKKLRLFCVAGKTPKKVVTRVKTPYYFQLNFEIILFVFVI